MESDIINELKSHFAAKEYWIEHFKTLWMSTLKENEKQAKQIKDLESQLSTKIETDQLICASRLLSEMQVKIVNLEAKLKAKETENHSILKKLEEVSVESKTKIFRIQQENEALKKIMALLTFPIDIFKKPKHSSILPVFQVFVHPGGLEGPCGK